MAARFLLSSMPRRSQLIIPKLTQLILPSRLLSSSAFSDSKIRPPAEARSLQSGDWDPPCYSYVFPEKISEMDHYIRWMFVMKSPQIQNLSGKKFYDFLVRSVGAVIGSNKEAKKKIYSVSCEGDHMGFCAYVDKETREKLRDMEGVQGVIPDYYHDVRMKYYTNKAPRSKGQGKGRMDKVMGGEPSTTVKGRKDKVMGGEPSTAVKGRMGGELSTTTGKGQGKGRKPKVMGGEPSTAVKGRMDGELSTTGKGPKDKVMGGELSTTDKGQGKGPKDKVMGGELSTTGKGPKDKVMGRQPCTTGKGPKNKVMGGEPSTTSKGPKDKVMGGEPSTTGKGHDDVV